MVIGQVRQSLLEGKERMNLKVWIATEMALVIEDDIEDDLETM